MDDDGCRVRSLCCSPKNVLRLILLNEPSNFFKGGFKRPTSAFRSAQPRDYAVDILTPHAFIRSAFSPLQRAPLLTEPASAPPYLSCMANSFALLIDNSSPALSYFPFADTLSIPNFTQGWNPCFSTSACPTFPGQQGNGSSFHVTSMDGAAFSIQWWGMWALNVFRRSPPSSSN